MGILSKKKILITFFTLGAIALVLYFLFGFFVNHILNEDILEQYFKKMTNLELELKNSQFKNGIDLSFSFVADEISVSCENAKSPFLVAKKPNLKIRLLPLLFSKINIAKLSVQDFNLNLTRQNNGDFAEFKNLKSEKFGNKKDLFVNNLELNKGKIVVLDLAHNKNLNFQINNLKLNNFTPKKSAFIDLKSTLEITDLKLNKKSATNFDLSLNYKMPFESNLDDFFLLLNLSEIDFSFLQSYFAEFLPLNFQKTSGKLSLNIETKNAKNKVLSINSNLGDLDFRYLVNSKSANSTLLGQSNFNSQILLKQNEIEILSSELKTQKSNIIVSGKISSYLNDKINQNVKILVRNSDFGELLNLVPRGVIPYKTDVVEEIKNAKPHAKINGELNVAGNFVTPDVFGDLAFQDIYLFERPENFETAIAKCKFIGQSVDVDVFVPAPNFQFVKIKGNSKLYGELIGKYEVLSSSVVDLAYAHKYLVPIKRALGFKLGPVPDMQISGLGSIHIFTEGTIDNAVVNGKFSAKNASATLKGLSTPIKNANLNLTFDKKVVKVDKMFGDFAGGKFKLSGFADDYNNIDMLVELLNVDAKSAIKMAKESDIIKKKIGDISFVNASSGKINSKIYLKGKPKTLEGVAFLDEIQPYGTIDLKDVKTALLGKLIIDNTNGVFKFSDKYFLDLKSDFKGSKIALKGDVAPLLIDLANKKTQYKLNLVNTTQNLLFSDIIKIVGDFNYFGNKNLSLALKSPIVNDIDFLSNANLSISGVISAYNSAFDFSKLNLNGKIVPINSLKSKNIEFINGDYKFVNSKFVINNSKIKLFGSEILSSGEILNILKLKPILNLKIASQRLNLQKLVDFANLNLPFVMKNLFSQFSDLKGDVAFDLDIKKNIPNGKLTLNNLSAFNTKQNANFTVRNADIKLKGQNIVIDGIGMTYGSLPMFFEGKINNFLSQKQKINAYFTTNFDEKSADLLFNPYLTYPIKIDGELRLKGRLVGDFDNYTLFSYLTVPKGSNISYMGAILDDLEYEREISARLDVLGNKVKINPVKYLKYVKSQNNKPTPLEMIKITGGAHAVGDNIFLDNISITTPNSVNAKLFNVLFKKSILKQGLFDCDLKISGNALKPVFVGNIKARDVNIPLYNTKINDIKFDISPKNIEGVLIGKAYNSDIELLAKIVNKPDFPIVLNDLQVKSKKISLSEIVEGLAHLPKTNSDFNPSSPIVFGVQDLIIKKGKLLADEVLLNDLVSKNLSVDFSNLTGETLVVDKMVFDIAGGKVLSDGSFDVLNSNFKLNSFVDDCDINILAKSFLGLQNQIYGVADAQILLQGKIPDNLYAIENYEGRIDFSLNNGKMPKLGSLEYLLRAGNLFKSGLLGLTLNNIIEVLTPYKTGEFSKISGGFNLKNATIDDLEIYSKGKNLSLFIFGNYDIFADNADIEILGRLSKKVSNLLGPIGNASLNSLLNFVTNKNIKESAKTKIFDSVNKIPLIELTGDDYRLFAVKVMGSLNVDNYVKSFNWLN